MARAGSASGGGCGRPYVVGGLRFLPRRPALWAAVLLLVAGPVRADPEVAAFLLDQAQKAISHRDYDDAARKLERALEEDPTLLEAAYLLGTVREKQDDPGRALAAYRRFRDACRAQSEAGSLDRKLGSYLKKAEKRIEILGRGEGELAKLQSSFAKDVLAFVRRYQKDDEDIAVHALRRLLAVCPQQAEAKTLLESIVGVESLTLPGGEVDPRAVPLPGIEHWDDLLDRQAIAPGQKVSYHKGVLVIEQGGENGSIFWLRDEDVAPDYFVYEMDFRVTKEYAPTWAVGFAMGRASDPSNPPGGTNFCTAFVQKTLGHLVHVTREGNRDVAEAVIDPLPVGAWVRLTLAVEGRKAELFVDGKRVVTSSVAGRRDLGGVVGIFHQRCASEMRLLRLGTR